MNIVFHIAPSAAGAAVQPADYTPAYIAGLCVLTAALIAMTSLWASDRRKRKADFRGKAHGTVTTIYNEVLKALDPFYKTQGFAPGDHRHITALHPSMVASLAIISNHVSALGIISGRCKKAAQRVHDVCQDVYNNAGDQPMTAEQAKGLRKAKAKLERATRSYLQAA